MIWRSESVFFLTFGRVLHSWMWSNFFNSVLTTTHMRRILTLAFAAMASLALGQVQTGKASFYADKFEGNPTASGEKYKHSKLTAAHRTLPFGTRVKVT